MQDSNFDPEGSSDDEAKPAAKRQQSEGDQGSTPAEDDEAEVCSLSFTCPVNAANLPLSSKHSRLAPDVEQTAQAFRAGS